MDLVILSIIIRTESNPLVVRSNPIIKFIVILSHFHLIQSADANQWAFDVQL